MMGAPRPCGMSSIITIACSPSASPLSRRPMWSSTSRRSLGIRRLTTHTMMGEGMMTKTSVVFWRATVFSGLVLVSWRLGVPSLPASLRALGRSSTDRAQARASSRFDTTIRTNADRMVADGRQTFRFETFGSEGFWGEALQLHRAIAGRQHGGVGAGLSPKTALSVGLKVDVDALPPSLQRDLKAGKVDLDDPATTLGLLKVDAVLGVKGFFDARGDLRSIGIRCALCHSTVDDAFMPGVGRRLDGWANRDLNVGMIVSLAPNLQPFSTLLGVDVETVKQVLLSWGPGRFDAELDKDGKAFRPDGQQAGTLIP